MNLAEVDHLAYAYFFYISSKYALLYKAYFYWQNICIALALVSFCFIALDSFFGLINRFLFNVLADSEDVPVRRSKRGGKNLKGLKTKNFQDIDTGFQTYEGLPLPI
jgi:hypothetical protein